jgi:hypothetical protein
VGGVYVRICVLSIFYVHTGCVFRMYPHQSEYGIPCIVLYLFWALFFLILFYFLSFFWVPFFWCFILGGGSANQSNSCFLFY